MSENNNNFIDGQYSRFFSASHRYLSNLSNEGLMAAAVDSTDGRKPTHRDLGRLPHAGSKPHSFPGWFISNVHMNQKYKELTIKDQTQANSEELVLFQGSQKD